MIPNVELTMGNVLFSVCLFDNESTQTHFLPFETTPTIPHGYKF